MSACIVCGIDDSDGARRAAHVADELAQRLGGRLVLVHGTPVAPSVLYGVPFDTEAFQREALADAERILKDVARTCATGADIEWDHERRRGASRPSRPPSRQQPSHDADQEPSGDDDPSDTWWYDRDLY